MLPRTTSPTELSHQVTRSVRILRRSRGWSLRELAERLGAAGCPVSQMTLGRRERGDGKRDDVSVDELYAFASVFGVPAASIVDASSRCDRCQGLPPAGLRCLACGAENHSHARQQPA